MNAPTQIVPPYRHTPLFPLGKDNTTYRKISSEGVRVEKVMGKDVLVVTREAMRLLSEAAFMDINHLLRPGHLESLKRIVEDPEASDNDKFVAFDFLKNANIAAGGVLPVAEPGAVAPTPVEFPLEEADREALEGMVLAPQGDWTVTDNYSLNQYGSLGIVPGTTPLDNPTSVALPGAEAQAVAAANAQQLIVLDDGATTNFMRSPGNQNPLPYLDADQPVRVGAGLEFTTGVILDWRFDAWSFQPLGHLTDATAAAVQPVTIEDTRPAEAAPEAVGGNVTVGSFNVLNYFTTLGQDVAGCSAYRDRAGNPVTTNGCLPRGAYTSEAFARQQEKIAAAINGLGTSVVALEEIENSEKFGLDRDHALAHLVEALNAQAGEQRWAYVASPTARPALADEDVIRSAFIYQPAEVTPVGESVILDDQTNFDNAREPMAQLFRAADGTSEGAAGTDFVAITNHFKSKGGSGATGDNVDAGDGQGAYNADRVGQAEALVAFAERMKAETGTDRVLLMGDFNAYEKEDPIRVLEAAGYVSQGALTGEYSYAFGGAVGSLDGIYASPSAAAARAIRSSSRRATALSLRSPSTWVTLPTLFFMSCFPQGFSADAIHASRPHQTAEAPEMISMSSLVIMA